MNPWHDVSAGLDSPEWINGIIENPKEDTRANYVLDKKTGLLNLESVVYAASNYPANYGFIPKTYTSQKEPLDILILSSVSISPLCIVKAKVIGAICFKVGAIRDDKIIAVAANDPSVNFINEIMELPQYHLDNIEKFIAKYKLDDDSKENQEKIQQKTIALNIIAKAMDDYKAKY